MNSKAMTEFVDFMNQMGEASFYSLARNYLGKLHSPFDRLKIARMLAVFVQKEETQARMLELLDSDDLQVLSSVLVCTSIDLGEESTLSQELRGLTPKHPNKSSQAGLTSRSLVGVNAPFSKLKTESKLRNLQERLWLVMNNRHEYEINPLLKATLASTQAGEAYLFGAGASPVTPAQFWLTDPFLLALVSLLPLSPSQAVLRIQELTGVVGRRHAEELIAGCKKLHLLSPSGPPVLQLKSLESFAALSTIERVSYLLSAMAVGVCATVKMGALTQALAHFLGAYTGRCTSKTVLERLYGLYAGELMPEGVMNFLEEQKLWQLVDDGLVIASLPMPATSGAVLTLEPNFQVQILPEAPFILGVALAMTLERFDTLSLYNLTKESFHAAIKVGYSTARLEEELRRYQGFELVENFTQTLNHWNDYFTVSHLYHGFIFTIEEQKNHLLASTKALDTFIDKEIAPCVYLLKAKPDDAFFTALSKLGLAHPMNHHSPPTAVLVAPMPAFNVPVRCPELPTFELNGDNNLKELASGTQNPELKYRIQRKIILFPSQLEQEEPKVLEARGIDFQTKLRLIERAIEQKNLLELFLKRRDDTIKLRLLPLSIDKKTDERPIKAYNPSVDKVITFSANHIVHIKMIEASLI